jgi:hypothetical protein
VVTITRLESAVALLENDEWAWSLSLVQPLLALKIECYLLIPRHCVDESFVGL